MARDHEKLVEEIFLAAIEAGESGQGAVLRERCGDDARLRQDVEELLGLHGDEAGGMLDRENPVSVTGVLNFGAAKVAREETLPLGTKVGAYTIRGVLGSGGMGVVYVAEQDRPRRTVALKLIRHGFATSAMLRRFEHEADVLGRLHHPGIAQIFEAGTADMSGAGGRMGRLPFLAMELVSGLNLTEFCDKARLTLNQRVGLLVKVCDAVQHAHTKGIIHRDLKPANILVQAEKASVLSGTSLVPRAGTSSVSGSAMAQATSIPHDSMPAQPDSNLTPMPALAVALGADSTIAQGRAAAAGVIEAQPKILDFGVARMMTEDAMNSMHTSVGQLIGTLAYMSPEQVAGDPREIDTRSDIYSLGVIAYQVLSGRTPHDVSGRGLAEAARMIRDEPPPRLSTIHRGLRGDLETIVAKAIEKPKDRRYQTAAALGADLARYLVGEPIEAKRDSIVYVVHKQIRRHRAAAALSLALLIAIVFIAAYAGYQATIRGQLNTRLEQELAQANIERGRMQAIAGNPLAAERSLWRELLRNPQSRGARWALWEVYRQFPVRWSAPWPQGAPPVVCRSASGKRVVSLATKKHVQVWDTTSSIWTLTADWVPHDDWVAEIAISPDGSMIATCEAGGDVALWDPKGTPLATLTNLNPARTLVFSPSGERLFVAGNQKGAVVIDVHSRKVLASLEADIRIFQADYSPDGRFIAVTGPSKLVMNLDARNLAVLRSVSFDPKLVTALRFHPDGQILFAGATDGTVAAVAVPEMSIISTHSVAAGNIVSLNMDEDATMFAIGGHTDLLVVDGKSLEVSLQLLKDADGPFEAIVDPNGRWVAVSMAESGFRRFDSTPDRTQRLIAQKQGWVTSCAFTPDDRVLIHDADPASMVFYDVVGRTEIRRIPLSTTRVHSIDVSPDGSLAAAGLEHGEIAVYRVFDGSLVTTVHQGDVLFSAVRFSPDGSKVIGVGIVGDVVCWNTSDWSLRWVQTGWTAMTQGASFSPDSRRFAVAGFGPRLRLLNTEDGEILAEPPAPLELWDVAFDRTGTRLLISANDATPFFLDPKDGGIQLKFRGHSNVVLRVCFNRDYSLAATASTDGTVKLWDPATGLAFATLTGHVGQVSVAQFSNRGSLLATAGQDGTVRLWNLREYDDCIAGNAEFWAREIRDDLGESYDPAPLMVLPPELPANQPAPD